MKKIVVLIIIITSFLYLSGCTSGDYEEEMEKLNRMLDYDVFKKEK